MRLFATRIMPMPMKLFYSPISDVVQKSLVVADELGLTQGIDEVAVYPRKHGYSIAAINPLAKVPTLALEDGRVLFGSQTIVEYFDSISVNGKRVYPASGPDRWDALTRLALADILFDIVVRIGQERLVDPPGEHIVQWNWPKLMRGLDHMERGVSSEGRFDIGDISTLQALTYFERQVAIGIPGPVQQNFNWREGHPQLSGWFEKALQRPSVADRYKKPFAGNDSPEACQRHVSEVLRLQGIATDDTQIELPAVDFVAPRTASEDLSARH
jgi:glutathione S-transferase